MRPSELTILRATVTPMFQRNKLMEHVDVVIAISLKITSYGSEQRRPALLHHAENHRA